MNFVNLVDFVNFVDFEDFASMPDEPYNDEEEDEEDEEEEQQSNASLVTATVEYEVDDLRAKIVRVRRGLRLYSKYLKVFRAVEGGNILKVKDNSVFNLEIELELGIDNYRQRG